MLLRLTSSERSETPPPADAGWGGAGGISTSVVPRGSADYSPSASTRGLASRASHDANDLLDGGADGPPPFDVKNARRGRVLAVRRGGGYDVALRPYTNELHLNMTRRCDASIF